MGRGRGRRRKRGSRRAGSSAGASQPGVRNPPPTISSLSSEGKNSSSGPPADSISGIASSLGNYGFILVLLETPSGFAVFCMDGVHLYLPDAMENIWANFTDESRANKILWLKEFQTFEDKSNAIRLDTGIDRKLTDMIINCRRPGQRVAVEKPEYKTAIEKHLKIPCLHDEAVMEVMWGLKHLMNILVSDEQSKLAKDSLHMSYGLNKLLVSHGLSNVNPEIVNEHIIATAGVLFDCVSCEKNNSGFLRDIGDYLKDMYGFNTQDWGLIEIATAMKMIAIPDGEIVDDPQKMFSEKDIRKFKYVSELDHNIPRHASYSVYTDMVSACALRPQTEKALVTLIHQAETEQNKGTPKEVID